jgi:hypothetical protein
MKSVQHALLLVATTVAVGFAQTSATGSANTNTATQTTTPAGNATTQANSATAAAAQGGTVIPVELPKSIDSKKAKVGDEVTAKVITDVRSGGAVAIPRGSKLIGKITQANARAKGDATSSLGIVFDRAVLKNGSALNLVSTIQAVIAAPQASPPTLGDDSGSGPAGGGSNSGGDLMGRATSTTGAVANTAGSAVGAVGNTAGSAVGGAGADVAGNTSLGANAPIVTSRTTGVVGIKGLELNAAASSETGSTFSSSSKSVKLDTGTRLLVNVSAASPESNANSAPREKK